MRSIREIRYNKKDIKKIKDHLKEIQKRINHVKRNRRYYSKEKLTRNSTLSSNKDGIANKVRLRNKNTCLRQFFFPMGLLIYVCVEYIERIENVCECVVKLMTQRWADLIQLMTTKSVNNPWQTTHTYTYTISISLSLSLSLQLE